MGIQDKYDFVEIDGHYKFLVDGKDGSEQKGQSFFKYYSLENYSVDALTNLYVYATHPCQLNDPLDCADELIKFDSEECARILWDKMYPSVAEYCQNNQESIMQFTQKAYKTFLYRKWGVLALSKKWNDVSMWSAYCNHKGFCAELDIFGFPFKTTGPFHVNYHESLTPISIKENSLQIATIYQTNVKLKCWEHENEWRLLIESPQGIDMEPFGEFSTAIKNELSDYHNRKFKYPISCLKSVTLGKKFFNGMHEVISDYETEIIATEELQNKVLSFLALSKVPTYWLRVEELAVYRQPIGICKIKEGTYRVTC